MPHGAEPFFKPTKPLILILFFTRSIIPKMSCGLVFQIPLSFHLDTFLSYETPPQEDIYSYQILGRKTPNFNKEAC